MSFQNQRKKVYALFFDFDGTIADTERAHYFAFKKVLERFNFELTWEDYLKKYLAYKDEDFFSAVAPIIGIGQDQVSHLCEQKKEIFSQFIKEIKLYPGIEDFIRYMGDRGYLMCIVSGALRSEIETVLEKFQLLKYFKFIVSAEDYKHGKPSPESFEIAMKIFKDRFEVELDPVGCVAFEDSIYGVEAAKKLNFFVVAVTNFYSTDELKKCGADIVIQEFSDPPKIEQEILKKIGSRVFEGDRVLLSVPGKNKTFLFRVLSKSQLHTHLGFIDGKDLLGRYIGEKVYTNKGKELYILEPTLADKVMKLERKSAIIYPKDSAFMIFLAGIGPGSKVVESGAGSGGLTIPLAHFVRPSGKVYVYEIRSDFIKILKKNLDENDLSEYVEVKERDVYKFGFDETEVDAVFLDLPEPWHCVRFAWNSLKNSGVLISVSPTVNQTEIMCEVMRREGFILIDTFEVLVRRFLAREGKSRPYENMIAHTAYISVGRKVLRD